MISALDILIESIVKPFSVARAELIFHTPLIFQRPKSVDGMSVIAASAPSVLRTVLLLRPCAACCLPLPSSVFPYSVLCSLPSIHLQRSPHPSSAGHIRCAFMTFADVTGRTPSSDTLAPPLPGLVEHHGPKNVQQSGSS